MSKFIKSCCLVLPSGETLWFEYDKDYLRSILDKRKLENQEYVNNKCTSGAVIINMPMDKYLNITANYGGGAFEFPK